MEQRANFQPTLSQRLHKRASIHSLFPELGTPVTIVNSPGTTWYIIMSQIKKNVISINTIKYGCISGYVIWISVSMDNRNIQSTSTFPSNKFQLSRRKFFEWRSFLAPVMKYTIARLYHVPYIICSFKSMYKPLIGWCCKYLIQIICTSFLMSSSFCLYFVASFLIFNKFFFLLYEKHHLAF